MTKKLIGVSLRVENIHQFNEKRDAISQDWTEFLSKIDAYPILIPNLIDDVKDFLDKFDLDLIILSGGDNIGEYPERDKTEVNILEYAIKKDISVLGVCRGMQLINHYFGGKIVLSDNRTHVGIPHPISFLEKSCIEKIGSNTTVNSFHNNLVLQENLGVDLKEFAIAEDKTIEGIFHKKFSVVGVMWHPERDENQKFELELIKMFQEKLFWK